jgi:hypothetical protein
VRVAVVARAIGAAGRASNPEERRRMDRVWRILVSCRIVSKANPAAAHMLANREGRNNQGIIGAESGADALKLRIGYA